jgi:hypothetical protein
LELEEHANKPPPSFSSLLMIRNRVLPQERKALLDQKVLLRRELRV